MSLKRMSKAAVFLMAAILWALPVQAHGALLTQPQVGAKAAVVMEALTGRVVFWQQGDVPMPMASTTKIMTTLLALEQQNLDELRKTVLFSSYPLQIVALQEFL